MVWPASYKSEESESWSEMYSSHKVYSTLQPAQSKTFDRTGMGEQLNRNLAAITHGVPTCDTCYHIVMPLAPLLSRFSYVLIAIKDRLVI